MECPNLARLSGGSCEDAADLAARQRQVAGVWSAPVERRSDLGQDGADDMGVVINAELVGHCEQERVGLGDRLVSSQFLDELVRFGGVAAPEYGPGILVDEANLIDGLVPVACCRFFGHQVKL